MRKKTKLFLFGIGSVLDIMPRTDFWRFIPQQTPEERMRQDWERVGQSLWRAVGQFDQEQEAGKRS